MFSQQLINRVKDYFQERHGAAFSDEQAIDCLNSLADFYLLFTKQEGEGFSPDKAEKPSPSPSDLISTHSC